MDTKNQGEKLTTLFIILIAGYLFILKYETAF